MDLTINYNEQMLNYYPEVIKSIREFQKLIEVQSLEIDDMHKELAKILENAYVSTADTDTILKWERALEIVPTPQGDRELESWMEDRRSTILARLYNTEKLNSTTISNIVKIFTGGEAITYFKDSTIYVIITPPKNTKSFSFENVERELRNKAPAHLLINVSRSYKTWGDVKTTFGTWGDVNDTFEMWEDVSLNTLSD